MQIEAPTFGPRDRFRLQMNGRKGMVVTAFWSQRHQKTAYLVLYDQQKSISLLWNLEQAADKMLPGNNWFTLWQECLGRVTS
jgi:hypothetical protein